MPGNALDCGQESAQRTFVMKPFLHTEVQQLESYLLFVCPTTLVAQSNFLWYEFFPHVVEHSNGWSWMVLALDFWQECGRWQIWMLEDMFWYDVSGKGWEWWFWIIALTLLSSRMTSGFSSGGLSLRAYRCAVLSTGKSPDQTQLKKCEFALRGAVFGMTQSRHIGARNRVSTWVIASLASVASCFIFFFGSRKACLQICTHTGRPMYRTESNI